MIPLEEIDRDRPFIICRRQCTRCYLKKTKGADNVKFNINYQNGQWSFKCFAGHWRGWLKSYFVKTVKATLKTFPQPSRAEFQFQEWAKSSSLCKIMPVSYLKSRHEMDEVFECSGTSSHRIGIFLDIPSVADPNKSRLFTIRCWILSLREYKFDG